MEPELWQRITDLFDEAMTRGAKKSALRFLEEACEGPTETCRRQVERLVKSHEKIGRLSRVFSLLPWLPNF